MSRQRTPTPEYLEDAASQAIGKLTTCLTVLHAHNCFTAQGSVEDTRGYDLTTVTAVLADVRQTLHASLTAHEREGNKKGGRR